MTIENFLQRVCGSPLWDSNAVYSLYPDFTICFQNTLLVWTPCLFLWLTSIFLFLNALDKFSNDVDLKFSKLLLAKTISVSILIAFEAYNLFRSSTESRYLAFILTPSLLVLTYGLVLIVLYASWRLRFRYNINLFLFWLMMSFANGLILRSKIIYEINKNTENSTATMSLKLSPQNINATFTSLDIKTFYASFTFIIISMILSAMTDKNFNHSNLTRRPPKEETVNLISYLLFWWTNPLIRTGFKRDVKENDLYEIPDENRSKAITDRMESEWNIKLESYLKKLKLEEEETFAVSRDKTYKSKDDNDDEDVKLNLENNDIKLDSNSNSKSFFKWKFRKQPHKATSKTSEPSLSLCLIKIFFIKFTTIITIKLLHDTLNFARPILLDKLINFIKDKEQKLYVGFFYIFLLCLASLVQTLIIQHYYQNVYIMGNQMKNGLQNLIYRKSLNLSSSARKMTTVGEMTNLLTTNCATFEWSTYYLVSILSIPLQVAITTFMLWQYLRWATLAGMTSMILFMPINVLFTRISKRIRKKKYRLQDARIKTMNEVLAGIRVVKFYGWEVTLMSLIKKLRSKELSNLIKTSLVSTLSSLVLGMSTFVIAGVSFLVYILIDENNQLDPSTAFVSLTLINMLRNQLIFLPYVMTGLVNLNVSLTRIRKFLLREEVKVNDVSNDSIHEYSILVENVNLGWSKSDELLSNINFKVKRGSLVAIVGKVGSGKSSLLAGLLNQMHKLNESGRINIDGKIAYVPQQAWIQNATVRNNILFNNGYNEDLYKKVLKSCCLLPDLDIMVAGDKTEIGEKGINLSGGQKARVSLARSLYSNANIYMLDDPLSAVDSQVGKSIFDMVIGPNSMLKDKTRLFVTNSLNFLPQVDEIIMIENGFIVEAGTYDYLIGQNGKFTQFMKAFLDANETNQEFIKNIDTVLSSYDKQASIVESIVSENDKTIEKSTKKIVEKEFIESGSVKMKTIFEYFKACRLWLSFFFLLMYVLSNMADMGSNLWLSDWSDDAIKTNNNSTIPKSNFYRLAVYSGLSLAKSLIVFLGNLIFVLMFIKATKRLHNKLLLRVMRSDLKFFESTPNGRIINRFTKDIEATEESIPNAVKSLIDYILSLSSIVFIISSSTPLVFLALIPVIVVYVLVQRYFIPSNRQLKRMQSASKSPIFAHFSESQAGLMTIRAYEQTANFIKMMEDFIDESFKCGYAISVSNRWLALRLELLGNLITILAALFAIIARDTLSAGKAGLSISQSLGISATLSSLVRTMGDFEANITSVERIKEYCEIQQEPEWSIEETKPSSTWPDKGKIRIENYSLKYRNELDYVLKDLNVEINAGEKIGIVGRTGAGKSTLTLAMLRMIETTKGKIFIDNVDINTIGLHDLRHKLTIIPQDPVIFSGSIRMNLDPFGTFKDEDLWKALELAHLKDFIETSPKKLEFECSEGGDNLSVGQRQLICLARSLLRKTNVLILDEATASIDHNTDELIQQTIRTQFADCTVLTIAHRLNTIMDSTKILVLDKGKVVEFDAPKQLLTNKNSIFYSMAEQAGLISK